MELIQLTILAPDAIGRNRSGNLEDYIGRAIDVQIAKDLPRPWNPFAILSYRREHQKRYAEKFHEFSAKIIEIRPEGIRRYNMDCAQSYVIPAEKDAESVARKFIQDIEKMITDTVPVENLKGYFPINWTMSQFDKMQEVNYALLCPPSSLRSA